MRSAIPRVSEVGLILFLLIVNDLQHAVEALVLIFVGDVKMVNRRPKYISIQSFLILTTWDWSQTWDLPMLNPAKRNSTTIGREALLRLSLFPR